MEPKDPEKQRVEELLREADNLVDQIQAEIKADIAAQNRLKFEVQAAALENCKAAVQEKLAKPNKSSQRGFSSGIHEAIDELAKAIGDTAQLLRFRG